MVRTLEKKTDLKKKKKLSEEDEKEECYRFADTWVVLEEEWKELNKKWDDIYFNSGKKKFYFSPKIVEVITKLLLSKV